MNFFWVILYRVFIVFYINLFFIRPTIAENPSPSSLELPFSYYSSTFSDHFDYYVHALSHGAPIGQMTEKEGSAQNQSMQVLKQNILVGAQNYRNSQKKFLEQTLSTNQIFSPLRSHPLAFVVKSDTVPKTLHLEELYKCIEKTLPLLKKAILYQMQNDISNLVTLDALLFKVRGDGSEISGAGLVCGKYLGPYGFKTQSYVQNVKVLSTLWLSQVRAPQNAAWKFFLAYSLAQQANTIIKAHSFWEYAWERVCFEQVLHVQRKHALQEIQKEFLLNQKSAFMQQVSKMQQMQKWVQFHVSDQTTANQIAQDWEHIEKLVGTLK